MEHTIPQIGIIGFGSLMESLLPCCDILLQGKREGNLFAVKGSAENLAQKQAQYSFSVTADSPLEMLLRVKPQVILFSPPPTLAEKLTETVLKPYYDELRRLGLSYPLLLCFPPRPLPRYYRKILGAGIAQATLMPCVVQRAGRFPVGKYGYSLVSMDGKAMPSREQMEQLLEFTRPIGKVLNVSQDDLSAALAGMVTAHNVYELCFTLRDAFSQCGQEVSLPVIASQMRFALRQFGPELPAADTADMPLCRQEDISRPCRRTADIVIRAWYEGLCQFAASQGLDLGEYGRFLRGTMDVLLASVQEESPERLLELSAGCATKGGLLERALEVYPSEIGEPLNRWAREQAGKNQETETPWAVELVERCVGVARAVFERGEKISD